VGGGENVVPATIYGIQKKFHDKKIFLRKLFMARHYNRVSSAIIAERKKKNCLSHFIRRWHYRFLLLKMSIHINFQPLFMHSLI
jgi:hypothetical protein